MARTSDIKLAVTVEPSNTVAARALREWIAEWPASPGDGSFLGDVARDGLDRADRLDPPAQQMTAV
jgi:hypothetical protein